MSYLIHAIMLLVATGSAPEDPRTVVAVIRNAYEENRAALGAHGTIRFRATHGTLGAVSSLEEISPLLKFGWKRLSNSRGLFVFDGSKRRYENLYPVEQLVSLRTKPTPTSYTSPIASSRVLTDGETTLKDSVNVSLQDDRTETHGPSAYRGTKVFFQKAEHLPLGLTNPEPSYWGDLSRCLRDLQEGREQMTLVEVDESAKLDGAPVVKLTIDLHNPRRQANFWVDVEHGAIPLRSRLIEAISGESAYVWEQVEYGDIRWVGAGWLPFRETHVLGNLTSRTAASGSVPSDGAFPRLLVHETVVDEADFEKAPDLAMFALEFPEEFSVNDSDRLLSLGSHRVWTLRDLSPAARAKARKLGVRSPASAPAMPGAREPQSWWPLALSVLGLTCLLGAGALFFHRWRSHAV